MTLSFQKLTKYNFKKFVKSNKKKLNPILRISCVAKIGFFTLKISLFGCGKAKVQVFHNHDLKKIK